jgi:hypothetical protein
MKMKDILLIDIIKKYIKTGVKNSALINQKKNE